MIVCMHAVRRTFALRLAACAVRGATVWWRQSQSFEGVACCSLVRQLFKNTRMRTAGKPDRHRAWRCTS